MDIRELKYFTQVAVSANYSAAAEKLYISQPALSKVIQKMERELGVKLFYTEHRQQCLTLEGRQLYDKAAKVIAGAVTRWAGVPAAVDDLRQALVLNPNQWEALMGFAAVLEEVGLDKDALEVWQRVHDMHPQNPEATEAVTRLEMQLQGRTL